MPQVALFSGALLSVVRCMPSVVFSTSFVARCPLPVACCMVSVALHVACCPLHVAGRLAHVACRALHVVCCSLHIARCVPHVVWMFSVARCVSSGAFSPLHIACRVLHFPRCMLSVVCCPFSSRRRRHAVRGIVSACTFFVACGLLPVSRPTVPCRMPCAVRRPSHVASRHVGCAALRVVCCMLHNAHPLLHVVAWLSPVPSCVPLVARCRVTQRHHRRSASRRRSRLSAAVAGEARCSADRGGRARVCACVCACVRVCRKRDGASFWVAVRA